MALLWVGIVFIVVAAAIVLALLSWIRGEFYFSRVKDNDTLSVEVRALFGLVRYRFVIPVIQFRGFTRGVFFQSETVNQASADLKDKRKDHITKDKIIEFYKEAKDLLIHTLNLHSWSKQTLARMECTRLRWVTQIGLGDAPETAITTGAVWGIKSSLLGFGARYVQMTAKPMVNVVPLYNQKQFATELHMKGRIRMWWALKAGIRLVVRAAKVKGGLRTWVQLVLKTRTRFKPAS